MSNNTNKNKDVINDKLVSTNSINKTISSTTNISNNDPIISLKEAAIIDYDK